MANQPTKCEAPEWTEDCTTMPARTTTVILLNDGDHERGIIRVSNGQPTSGAIQVLKGHGADGKRIYKNWISWKYRKSDTLPAAKAYLCREMNKWAGAHFGEADTNG